MCSARNDEWVMFTATEVSVDIEIQYRLGATDRCAMKLDGRNTFLITNSIVHAIRLIPTLTLNSVPRALVNFQPRGFIKQVAEQNTGRLLGGRRQLGAGDGSTHGLSLNISARLTSRVRSRQPP